MTVVDQKKFRHQTALQKHKAVAVGNCFTGLCAVFTNRGKTFAIISADMETLDCAWALIAGNHMIDKDGVQKVSIFSQDDTELRS